MPCCRRPSGAATGRRWRRWRPRRALGGGPALVVPPATVLAALEADLVGKVQALSSDPRDGLAAALASLGRAFMTRDS